MADKNSLYRKKILKELYLGVNLSCADLYVRIKKSFPVITKILNELIDEGIVVETGYATSTGGRRPLTYAIKADLMYVVSVAMDQFISRIVIVDMKNNFITEVEKFELNLAEDLKPLQVITEKIEDVISRSGIAKDKILGIGIGMPGNRFIGLI